MSRVGSKCEVKDVQYNFMKDVQDGIRVGKEESDCSHETYDST